MPTPTEQLARQLGESATSKYNILDEVRGVLESAVTDSTAEALPIVEETAGVTVEAFVLGVVGAIDLPFLVVVLLIIGALALLYYIIRHFAGNLRFVGGTVVGVIDQLFGFIPALLNYAVSKVEGAVSACIKGVLAAFTFLLGVTLPQVIPAPQTLPANKTGYATEAEIHFLQSEIDTLKQAVGTIQYVTTDKSVTVGVPQTLWDQIHNLEGEMHAAKVSITDLYGRTDRLTNTATSLEHQFQQLTSEIHAVRAVSTSWQDVEQQLENLGSLVTQLADETATQLGHLTSVQTQMLPLTLLLEPGVKGLRNLRKLEDNICQCPKFANIPNELGTALAVLEFVENG